MNSNKSLTNGYFEAFTAASFFPLSFRQAANGVVEDTCIKLC
jgi:hypothetical protein